jgi:hypothetical protein
VNRHWLQVYVISQMQHSSAQVLQLTCGNGVNCSAYVTSTLFRLCKQRRFRRRHAQSARTSIGLVIRRDAPAGIGFELKFYVGVLLNPISPELSLCKAASTLVGLCNQRRSRLRDAQLTRASIGLVSVGVSLWGLALN